MAIVRLVGINRFEDRHGRVRMYWRRKGAPTVALDPNLSGAALAAEVARLETLHLKPAAPRAGTLGGLIIDYKTRSNHWRTLRPRTRKDYERVFGWLGEARQLFAAELTPADIAETRDRARDEHEPKFANQVLTTLKMVFAHACETGALKENPAREIDRATRSAVDEDGNEVLPARGNRPCTPAEAAALLDHAPARLKPAIATALYFSLREGDTIALQKSARDGDWITTLQSKSRRAGKNARPVTGYVCKDYAAILDGIAPNDATTICVKSDGTPWSLEGFKTAWGRYRDDMLKRKLIGPGVTFHGLRHTGPTILEAHGYDETQTRYILGHGPRTVSGHYGVTADRRNLLKEMALVVEAEIGKGRGNVRKLNRA